MLRPGLSQKKQHFFECADNVKEMLERSAEVRVVSTNLKMTVGENNLDKSCNLKGFALNSSTFTETSVEFQRINYQV